VTAARSSRRPWAKRVSASIPLAVVSVIQASRASPRRSRTSARKAWLNVEACAMAGSPWLRCSTYRWASCDRFAAGHLQGNETARADGPCGRVDGEACVSGAPPASLARRSRVTKRDTVREE
jgi:hypothetical protein